MGYKYLEIGPEKNRHTSRAKLNDEWLTIGRSEKTKIDITCDLNESWNVEGEFEIIYAAHVLEHMDSPIHFLGECMRLLVPGGVLRITVPSALWLMKRYLNRQTTLTDCIEQLRSFLPGMHKHPFDRETLRNYLGNSGFSGIEFPSPCNSRCSIMRSEYFSTRPNRSIFVEASKPRG